MKAAVMEIKDGYAAVLTEDGQFIKIKDEGYLPGMEISLEKKEEKRDTKKIVKFRRKRVLTGIAAVAAAFLLFFGVKDFNTPYSVISLDVNPSIEISVNRYDMVLSVEAVNDDADEIVASLNTDGIKYKSLETVVDMALVDLSNGDYAAEDDQTYVMISANSESDNHSDKVAKQLENICKSYDNVFAEVITADDELVERAKELGTTAGKLYLVENLKDISGEENFDESDWLQKPVKDIFYEIDVKNDIDEDDGLSPIEGEDNPIVIPDSDKEIPADQGAWEEQTIPEFRDNGEIPSENPENGQEDENPPEKPDEGSDENIKDGDNPPQKPDEGGEKDEGGNPPELPIDNEKRMQDQQGDDASFNKE